MFTGIIKETGKVIRIKDIKDGKEMEFSCTRITGNILNGDSICVNGVCLTVKDHTGNSFLSDISFSTLSSSSFKNIKTGSMVNLEDSLGPGDKLGGHFVTGHVDATTGILEIEEHGDFYRIKLVSPVALLPYICQKGSIAVEGISLTVERSEDSFFTVVIIPHTFENTNLCSKAKGDEVNIEIDLIARYIGRIITKMDLEKIKNKDIDRDEILKEKLIKYGFYK